MKKKKRRQKNGEEPTAPVKLDWFTKVESIAARGDPEDDRRLAEAIREIREKEKVLARKRDIRIPE